MSAYQKILFVLNKQKPGSQPLADRLMEIARAHGALVFSNPDYPLKKHALDDIDLCCTVGGDGTLLGAVTEAVRRQIPVVGVNQGKLGYLTAFSPDEAVERFPCMLNGGYRQELRDIIRVTLANGESRLALNDIVIKEKNSAHMIHLEVHCNGEAVTEYRCDGLILSTPTGSTAYNLSAGGPLISPDSRVFAMTPICPHTLSNRALILNQDSEIEIRLKNDIEFTVIADGDVLSQAHCPFPLKISRNPSPLRLLQDPDRTAYSTMRQKLNWL